MASVRVANIRLNRYLSILASNSGSMFILIEVLPFAPIRSAYTVYSVLTIKYRLYILTMRYLPNIPQEK